MSGHSKWSTIKRKKAKVDAQRGKVFTRLSREIIVAARNGGGDPNANPRLKAAIQKAKEANIPNENIMRAVQKGTGGPGEANYEEVVYEGYAPGGVAVMVEAVTDNRNRTAGEIRHIFTRNGGSLGETGCVAWLFQEKGLILLNKNENRLGEDDLMLLAVECGAVEFDAEEDTFEITTESVDMHRVKKNLEDSGVSVASAEITMLPQTIVKIEGKEAEQTMRLVESLEEHDDVQNVYANFEVEDYPDNQ
ncbi:MAG TPA: YebC/PmpR family DNA-binding transcriptional regulator [Bacillota bacterium]|nr:YebC/PmpR family DNA-binding transcriptional regulator [Bacillota bacterium]